MLLSVSFLYLVVRDVLFGSPFASSHLRASPFPRAYTAASGGYTEGGGWKGGILFKARFTFLRRRHFLPKAPTRIGIRFIYIHIYTCTLPLPLYHSRSSRSGKSTRLVKEINALISSFSATYRPHTHGHPSPAIATPFLRVLSRTVVRRLLSGHHRSFATARWSCGYGIMQRICQEGSPLPEALRVTHLPRSPIIKFRIIKVTGIIGDTEDRRMF